MDFDTVDQFYSFAFGRTNFWEGIFSNEKSNFKLEKKEFKIVCKSFELVRTRRKRIQILLKRLIERPICYMYVLYVLKV